MKNITTKIFTALFALFLSISSMAQTPPSVTIKLQPSQDARVNDFHNAVGSDPYYDWRDTPYPEWQRIESHAWSHSGAGVPLFV